MSYLLPTTILLPLLGGTLLLLLFRNEPSRGSRLATIFASLTLIAAVVLASRFWNAPAIEAGAVQPRLLWKTSEIPLTFLSQTPPIIRFQLGLDAPGIAMILLTSIVMVAILLVVPKQIESKTTEYAASLLFAESFLLGAFLSMDLVSFYIFFELTLLPVMVLMIGWGTDQSRPATRKFVLFTLAGSLPMMAGLAGMATLASPNAFDLTIAIPSLANQWNPLVDGDMATSLPANLATQRWIFGLVLLGLGIKMAILPFHTWLPSTYAAAHPTTTALLAGVLLKLGLFGILRILLPILPTPAAEFSEFWGPALGAIAIVYGSLIALAQTDLRLLLAYGSLGHVGFITMGLFSLTEEGLAGAIIQMFNHGITTAAMFLIIAMLMRRRPDFDWSTRPSGLTGSFPILASMFLFFTIAGAGMPGLNNFVGEVLAMSGLIQRSLFWTAVASLGIIFGAWYGLRVIEGLFFGPSVGITSPSPEKRDLRRTELASLIPLALISIAIGVFPASAIDSITRDVAPIARHHQPERVDPKIADAAMNSTLAQRGQHDQ
jgi:NADH-quinone oxidoreductase subunit M